jgi:hypothetical protein
MGCSTLPMRDQPAPTRNEGGKLELGDPQRRWIIAGPSRSGTTVLAAIMSGLGISFGFEDQSWDANTGYYENVDILKAYDNMRKSMRLCQLSDNLGEMFRQRAVRCVGRALASVNAIKYPPLSCELPALAQAAGYKPKLAVSARRFETYALSRIRKEGVSWNRCKQDYLNIYHTSLFNFHLYGGILISYEELTSSDQLQPIRALMEATGETESKVTDVLSACVKESRGYAHSSLADQDCDSLYEQILAFR